MPGHAVPVDRRRGRVVLLRAGRQPETANVHGVPDERGADGIVFRVGARAHAGGRVPGRTHPGRRVPVPVRFGVVQGGPALSDDRRRRARLGGRRGLLRARRRSLGQYRRPPHADARGHRVDQQVSAPTIAIAITIDGTIDNRCSSVWIPERRNTLAERYSRTSFLFSPF